MDPISKCLGVKTNLPTKEILEVLNQIVLSKIQNRVLKAKNIVKILQN